MTQVQDNNSSAGKKVCRRSHRKSRNGCDNCKKRKIKCNEERPRCYNCTRHENHCSFETSPPYSKSMSGSPSQNELFTPQSSANSIASTTSPCFSGDIPISFTSPGEPSPFIGSILGSPYPSLNIMDLELLHNYNTSTSYTLSSIPALQHYLRVNVPRIGFSHPFVLHSILAISAVHLAHFKQGDSHSLYVTQAHYHYDIALRAATPLISEINEENCAALYIFGTICSPITLGMGAKPGDFLVFGDNGIPDWLVLFRGMRAILDSNPGLFENGELAPMFQISLRHINHSTSDNEHLRELEDLIKETAINDPDFEQYMSAVEKLTMSFPASPLGGPRTTQSSPQLVFVWLYRLSDDFVLCLQQRKPIALVILAHFCVLLHDLSSFWWLNGWVDHLMREIYASVNEEYRIWMRWPMEEIGWIPPE